jgi:hypothetical protein
MQLYDPSKANWECKFSSFSPRTAAPADPMVHDVLGCSVELQMPCE